LQHRAEIVKLTSIPSCRKALNHLTPAVRLAAAREVEYGESYQLDWNFGKIGTPSFGRKGLEHKVFKFEGALIHDDEVSFNTQAGSQWDGFMHQADQDSGAYYNGLKHHDNVLKEEEAHSTHCEFDSIQSAPPVPDGH
jgi:hypothetical protein